MLKNKPRVLVALSGGVDSAVAAALLVLSKRYQVTAAFMINYEVKNRNDEVCWVADYYDAIRVAAVLEIPILKFDFIKEYEAEVLNYMFKEYKDGRTPNPDVLCNKFIKFGVWLRRAKELGFNYLATGHYACLSQRSVNSKVHKVKLLEAKDKNKDQTYFLHQLNQEQLSQALFPIGNYTKPQIRNLAKKFKLPVAQKEESMGICFVGEVPMKDFLSQKIKPSPGDIILSTTKEVVGRHDGLAFYTIGQRHVGVQGQIAKGETKPLYVVDKYFDTNQLIVGFENDPLLYRKEVQVESISWISGQNPKLPLKCRVRLRHRQKLQDCEIVGMKDPSPLLNVKFSQSQRAVTPGQFAVFYKKGECLGGGVIK